jgi:hypothetical protein
MVGDQGRGSTDVPIKDNRYLCAVRLDEKTSHGGNLQTRDGCHGRKWLPIESAFGLLDSFIYHLPLPRQDAIVGAGATPHSLQQGNTRQQHCQASRRGRITDAHFAGGNNAHSSFDTRSGLLTPHQNRTLKLIDSQRRLKSQVARPTPYGTIPVGNTRSRA